MAAPAAAMAASVCWPPFGDSHFFGFVCF